MLFRLPPHGISTRAPNFRHRLIRSEEVHPRNEIPPYSPRRRELHPLCAEPPRIGVRAVYPLAEHHDCNYVDDEVRDAERYPTERVNHKPRIWRLIWLGKECDCSNLGKDRQARDTREDPEHDR